MPKRGLPSSTEARKVCVVCDDGEKFNVFFMDLDMNTKSTDVDIGGADTNFSTDVDIDGADTNFSTGFDVDGADANFPTGFGVDGAVSDFIAIKPAIRIKYPKFLFFCESNSFLYMFHASHRLLQGQWGHLEGLPMFKIDLSRVWCSDSTIELDASADNESMLTPCAQMKTSKRIMDTVKTPDGRILVFARVIRYFRSLDEFNEYKVEGEVKVKDEDEGIERQYGNGLVDFEIYDPGSDSWSSLPQLVLRVAGDKSFYLLCKDEDEDEKWMECCSDPSLDEYSDGNFFEIKAGSFINNTFRVVIQMGKVFKGFTLDIDDPQEGWTPAQGRIEPPCDCDYFLQVGDDGLMLTSNMAHRGTRNYELPWTCYPGHSRSFQAHTQFSVVDAQKKRVAACMVSTGTDYFSLKPYIICDLVRIDLSLETPPQLLGAFKYWAGDGKYHHFVPCFVFPISISATEESLEEEKHCKITAS